MREYIDGQKPKINKNKRLTIFLYWFLSAICLFAGQNADYREFAWRWSFGKIAMGLLTIILLLVNNIDLDLSGIFPPQLVVPAENFNIDNIDVELVVIMFGAVNTISVYLGERRHIGTTNASITLAVPFREPKSFKGFQNFNKRGYIFDFTNYFFLLYLLLSHGLLFGSSFIPHQEDQSSFVTIIIFLMVVFYMFMSLRAKAKVEEGSEEETRKNKTNCRNRH